MSRSAGDAVLLRPEPGGREQGQAGARRFWQAYLDQFWTITSTVGRVVDAGVSLLEHDDDAVVRFATYDDTSAFTAPA